MGRVRTGMVSLIFPGQGSQRVGMGRDICSYSSAARAVFESADDELGFSVSDICFNGPEQKLNSTRYCQPAVFTVSCACLAALKESLPGLRPGMLAGHSLGEFSALFAGAAFDFGECLRLVHKRGILMERACENSEGVMCAVLNIDAGELMQICEIFDVSPANINCPGQTVVSGLKENVAGAADRIKDKGGKILPLKVSGAFHSRHMKSAAEAFKDDLEMVRIEMPDPPVYSNVTAAPHTDASSIRRDLTRHLYSPVLWEKEVRRMSEDGSDVFIELGPGRVLSKLVSRIFPGARVYSVEDKKSLEETKKFLQGETDNARSYA